MKQIDSTSHSIPYGMINLGYRSLAPRYGPQGQNNGPPGVTEAEQ
jgi:hypothetical protein